MEKKRTRNWAFVMYPESMPENGIQFIKSLHIPAAISPLHTITDKDDTEIKPHYHVFLAFDGVKTKAQVIEIVSYLNGTRPEPVSSPRGYVRYLIHKDNPEKEQFKVEDIICCSGFEIGLYMQASEIDTLKHCGSIIALCDEYALSGFSQLVRFLYDHEMWDELTTVRKNASFFQYYMSSLRRGY